GRHIAPGPAVCSVRDRGQPGRLTGGVDASRSPVPGAVTLGDGHHSGRLTGGVEAELAVLHRPPRDLVVTVAHLEQRVPGCTTLRQERDGVGVEVLEHSDDVVADEAHAGWGPA